MPTADGRFIGISVNAEAWERIFGMQQRCLDCRQLIPVGTRKGRCTNCRRLRDAQRRIITPSVRQSVIAQANGQCQLQRPGCTRQATEVDHITPIRRGGTDTMSNYQAACKPCNSGKRDR